MTTKKRTTALVDVATPRLPLAKGDAGLVALTRSTIQVMKASAGWATAPDVQKSTTAWSAVADGIDQSTTLIANLKKQLSTAEASLRAQRADWRVAVSQVGSNIAVVANGSAEAVKAFGWEVVNHARLGLLPAVTDIVPVVGTLPGEAGVKWVRGLAKHGFLVQHATDPTNAATYSATQPSTKARYTAVGLTPSGSTVYMRVAAIDPASATTLTPWSAWVAAVVR